MKTPQAIVRNKEIIFRKSEGVVYIIDIKRSTIRILNDTASFIWQLIDKPMNPKAISESICNKYDVSKSRCDKDLKEFVKKYLDLEYVKKT